MQEMHEMALFAYIAIGVKLWERHQRGSRLAEDKRGFQIPRQGTKLCAKSMLLGHALN